MHNQKLIAGMLLWFLCFVCICFWMAVGAKHAFAQSIGSCYNLVEDYGADPTGLLDSTPAWNAAMLDQLLNDQARAGTLPGHPEPFYRGPKCLHLPAGDYGFDSLTDEILRGSHIFGDSKAQTVLIKRFEGAMLMRIGPVSGATIERLALVAGPGSTYGFGLYVHNRDRPVGEVTIRDVLINGNGGSFSWSMYADGDLGGQPPGIRGLHLANVTLHSGTGGSLFAKSVKNLTSTGLQTFGAITVTGTPSNPSDNIQLQGVLQVPPSVSHTNNWCASYTGWIGWPQC